MTDPDAARAAATAELRAEVERLKVDQEHAWGCAAGWIERAEQAEARVAALERVAEAGRAFEADLSDYCDGPERDELRSVLAALDGGRDAGGGDADA